MIDLTFKLLVCLLCAGVMTGCICRLDMSRAGVVRAGWIIYYTLAPVFAFGVGLSSFIGHPVDWYEVAGVGSIAAQLINTRHLWRKGPPAVVLKGSP